MKFLSQVKAEEVFFVNMESYFSVIAGINIASVFVHCVVPENIQTPTTEGIGNSRGVGGSEAQEIPEGRGVGP